MSLFPNIPWIEHHKDFELSKWKPKKELSDTVLKNFKELQAKYSEEKLIQITKEKNYQPLIPSLTIYGKEKSQQEYVAYDCRLCGGIVSSVPRIKAKNDIHALAGSERLEYYCAICNMCIGETIFKQS